MSVLDKQFHVCYQSLLLFELILICLQFSYFSEQVRVIIHIELRAECLQDLLLLPLFATSNTNLALPQMLICRAMTAMVIRLLLVDYGSSI